MKVPRDLDLMQGILLGHNLDKLGMIISLKSVLFPCLMIVILLEIEDKFDLYVEPGGLCICCG